MTKVDLLAIPTHLNDHAQEEDTPPCSGMVMEIHLSSAILLV